MFHDIDIAENKKSRPGMIPSTLLHSRHARQIMKLQLNSTKTPGCVRRGGNRHFRGMNCAAGLMPTGTNHMPLCRQQDIKLYLFYFFLEIPDISDIFSIIFIERFMICILCCHIMRSS